VGEVGWGSSIEVLLASWGILELIGVKEPQNVDVLILKCGFGPRVFIRKQKGESGAKMLELRLNMLGTGWTVY